MIYEAYFCLAMLWTIEAVLSWPLNNHKINAWWTMPECIIYKVDNYIFYASLRRLFSVMHKKRKMHNSVKGVLQLLYQSIFE